MQVIRVSSLGILLIMPACQMAHMQTATVTPPIATTSFARSWNSSKTGFIFSSSYFTADQVDDQAWEKRRLSEINFVRICKTGQRIAYRDVRWFPATRESGRVCAAVVYTVTCDVPTNATTDTLQQDRKEALLGELPSALEKDCGEKDWTKLLDRPNSDMQSYLKGEALLLDREVCDFSAPRIDGSISIEPQTRIGVTANIDRAFAERLRGPWVLATLTSDFERAPEEVIGNALRQQGRLGAIFPASHEVAPIPSNISITQAIGLGRDGRPYCVQITARQGGQTWRRTIERSGTEAYAGIGVFGKQPAKKPDHSPRDDERLLLVALTESMGLPSRSGGAR